MTETSFLDGKVTLHCGDCRDVLASMPDASVDSVVCDPPYALTQASRGGSVRTNNPETPFGRTKLQDKGFMGKAWDTGEVAFDPEFWAQVLRVLKPGGHLLAFSGTRTYHRMACAIEDAGFEIRDQIQWLYGAGFPKSHNVGKALDVHGSRCTCEGRQESSVFLQHDLRPLRDADLSKAEHSDGERREVLLARLSQQGPSGAVLRSKPEQGSNGAEEQCLEGRRDVPQALRKLRQRQVRSLPAGVSADGAQRRLRDGAPASDGKVDWAASDAAGVRSSQGPQSTKQLPDQSGTVALQSDAQTSGAWPTCGRCGKPIVPDGLGTALKPANEPICVARKPLIGTVAENVLTHGTGAINIDGCRIGVTDDDSIHAKNPNTKGGFGHGNAHVYGDSEGAPAFDPSQGRWPANLIHDGSDEVVECFPSDAGAAAPVYERNGDKFRNTYGAFGGNIDEQGSTFQGDSGSAARFFYQAKADSMDRVHRSYEDVEISWTSDQGPCQARLLVDTAQLPGMVIGASGSGESSEWSTFLFGSKLTARFPRDTKFTTATGTSSTTDSPIWNWLMRSLTNGCTAVASNAAMNGGSHAENAENSRPSLTITSAETVSLPGASHAVSGTPLTISVLGKRASHPTVKPIDLMQYLVRLVTPKGGTVLDPFAGTGTTGEAAWREGMKAILIEREAEYQADIAQRMDLATKPTKRAAVAKTKNNLEQPEDLPLFGGAT